MNLMPRCESLEKRKPVAIFPKLRIFRSSKNSFCIVLGPLRSTAPTFRWVFNEFGTILIGSLEDRLTFVGRS